MAKYIHEIRDPIHVFVRLDSDERKVLDSRPFQRPRHIHQLALTYQIYPAATHKRFEHSLGVMELVDRVFAVITQPAHVSDVSAACAPEAASGQVKTLLGSAVCGIASVVHNSFILFGGRGFFSGLQPPRGG